MYDDLFLSVLIFAHCFSSLIGVIFPWVVYVDITLETVALNTRNNVAVFITYASDKCAPTCPLSKSDKSPIFRFFHTDCHPAQSLIHWYEHHRVQRCQLKFFQLANTNSIPQFLSVSIILSIPCVSQATLIDSANSDININFKIYTLLATPVLFIFR
jgi:hypothetical protein